MNTFANSLFTVLFGWARGLIQQVWNAAVSGRFSGFFTWLGDHWVWVVLGLILGCTVMDYLIWMIRWRPYLVWRTKMRRFLRVLRGMLQRRFRGDHPAFQCPCPAQTAPAHGHPLHAV